jgi:hypothetical protein
MLYVGLDLSRKRLDWQALAADGQRAAIGAVPRMPTGSPGSCAGSAPSRQS